MEWKDLLRDDISVSVWEKHSNLKSFLVLCDVDMGDIVNVEDVQDNV